MKNKIAKLRKNFEFQKVIKRSHVIYNDVFIFKYVLTNNKIFKYGISISKSKIKTSVKRNYYKRIIRNFIRESTLDLSIEIIIIVKENILKYDFWSIQSKFNDLLKLISSKRINA